MTRAAQLPSTVDALDKLIEAAEQKRRVVKVRQLLKQKCDCDRYTCFRCQQLQREGYRYERGYHFVYDEEITPPEGA